MKPRKIDINAGRSDTLEARAETSDEAQAEKQTETA
jgi:hypothetical protein